MTSHSLTLIGSIALALALAATAGRAHAEERASPLDAAERALDELDFRTARSLLDSALRSGDNAPASLQRTYLLSGIVAASFGDRKAAVGAYRRALAIDPDADLPEGLAPKMTAPLAEARRRNRSRSISVGCAHSSSAGSIFATVESDPLQMVAGAVARYRDDVGDPRVESLAGARHMVFAIPDEATGRVQLAVVDVHGNQLATPCEVLIERPDAGELEYDATGRGAHGSTRAPSAKLSRKSPPTRGRPFVARWYAWGTLSLGLAAAGTYCGLEARQSATALSQAISHSDSYEFSDAAAIERRGKRQALASNVAFGAAAGVAVLGAILWLVTDDEPADGRRTVVSAMPSRGGASVGFTFAF